MSSPTLSAGHKEPTGTGANLPWERLTRVARGQLGYVSIRQVRRTGVTDAQIGRMFDLGEIERTRRGIYRFAAFPASSHGHLMIATLWPTLRSPRFRAVISHESALELHGLLPANQVPAHVTLPKRASMSRMVPPEFRLHYAELRSTEVKVVDSVTTTTVARAIQDVCANRGSGHDLHALIAQALTMGMLTAGEADELALLRPR